MEEMNMSEEEFAEKEQWVKKECICAGCPSYKADETALGFCWPSLGKSEMISEEKGCICGNCPVYKGAELTLNYYCTRDSEISQKMSGSSGM
ncbi:MAG TPA: DUF2769 domain-containing protein [Actinobacteria bacterium]|nr:DUF2769 domain-containing protein [Actinomycetota bacterium]